jgi:hypothetical protein
LKLLEIMVSSAKKQIAGSGSTKFVDSPANSELPLLATFGRETDKMGQCSVFPSVHQNKATICIYGMPFAV